MMRILLVCMIAAATGSCGFEAVNQAAQPDLRLAVSANSPQLTQIALSRIDATAQPEGRLVLDEQIEESIVSRGADGAADIIKLSYTLAYRLEDINGAKLHGSFFRYSQNISHNNAAIRASLSSRQRIFIQSRQRGVNQALREIAAVLIPSTSQ